MFAPCPLTLPIQCLQRPARRSRAAPPAPEGGEVWREHALSMRLTHDTRRSADALMISRTTVNYTRGNTQLWDKCGDSPPHQPTNELNGA